jgi:hypothetical protein
LGSEERVQSTVSSSSFFQTKKGEKDEKHKNTRGAKQRKEIEREKGETPQPPSLFRIPLLFRFL